MRLNLRASSTCRLIDSRSSSNIFARSRWRYTTPRPSAVVTVTPSTLHSENHRASWVATLICGRRWCSGSCALSWCSTPRVSRNEIASGLVGIVDLLAPPLVRGRRQRGRAFGSTTASGYSCTHGAHVGQRGLQDREDVLGSGQEVVHRLVLDRDGRILKAEKVFEGRLHVAGQSDREILPSQCMAATTNRLRRWKYACQSMASSLSLHAMCQIAAPGSVTVGYPCSPARRP